MAERVFNSASISSLNLTCSLYWKMSNTAVHNESFSYSFYVLGYQVEREQYNLTVVTRIMSVNDTNFFTTVVNIDPRDDKAVSVADIVFFTNKTTLADHYKLLGDVLNEIRKNDNTSWVWNKVRIELNELAKKVERDLAEYNVEGAGIAITIDASLSCLTCTSAVTVLCGLAYHYLLCVGVCTGLTEGWGAAVCGVICKTLYEIIIAGVSCNVAATQVCEYIGAC